MTDEEIKQRLQELEQQKIMIDFFGTGSKEEVERSNRILDEMQPMYEQLGGIFISKTNLNYIQPLIMYTLYDHPTDFPEEYVIRTWFVTKRGVRPAPDEKFFFKSRDLEECHHVMKKYHRIERDPTDDPKIICTYL